MKASAVSLRVNPAIPFEKWPAWAKGVALLKKDCDKGVGDTVERIIGKSNSAAYKAFYLATFKKSCGCSNRKAEWNVKYKY